MWELRRLTTLWAFTACCRDSFIFTYLTFHGVWCVVVKYNAGEFKGNRLGHFSFYFGRTNSLSGDLTCVSARMLGCNSLNIYGTGKVLERMLCRKMKGTFCLQGVFAVDREVLQVIAEYWRLHIQELVTASWTHAKIRNRKSFHRVQTALKWNFFLLL
jgi:hypothetical protein